MQAGARYQNQVTGWLAAKMLAERPAEPIAPRGKLNYLAAESGEAVDDILAGTDSGSFSFVQAKRKLSLSSREDSDLAGVVNQAVRQMAATVEPAKRPWSRPLNSDSDRLLLVTSSDSPATIKIHLRSALQRVSGLHPEQTIMDAAKNADECEALSAILILLNREWTAVAGTAPTEGEQYRFLKLFGIEVLDPGEGETNEREAKTNLSMSVLEDPTQENLAWTFLVTHCGKTAARQAGFTAEGLRRSLRDEGVNLKSLPSFAADIETLRRHTQKTLSQLAGLSRIQIGGEVLRVERTATTKLIEIADKTSCIVVGQPGAGKSGTVYDTAMRLIDAGRDVLCFAVDRLEFANLLQLQADLGLKHSLIDVIKAWDGNKKGVVVIDALDAARGAAAGDVILSLIQELKESSRWNVVASVRKWDLRYNSELRETFRVRSEATVPQELSDPEFFDVTHISVPVFSLEELEQICNGSPALKALRANANRETIELLRVPFNLRLAAELLDSGMEPAEFSPLRDQVSLLEAYWRRRVSSRPGGDSREQVLRLCLADMVANRRLRTSRAKALEDGDTAALEQLLSRNVLSEWQAFSAGQPDRQLLAFAHNVLFDFGAAELHLPHDPDDFLKMMAVEPDLALLVRPSLHMRFQQLWMTDKAAFWNLTFQLCADESLPALLQSCPLVVVAENAKTVEDVGLLATQLRRSPADQITGVARAYRHLVGVLVAGGPDNQPDLGSNAGPWLDLAADAIVPENAPQAIDVHSWLESALGKWGTQTVEQMTTLGFLARTLLERVWADSDRNGPWVKAAIKNVVTSFGSDCEASASLLRKAFEPDHLMQHGHEELVLMARDASRLARIAPEFVRDLYLAAFSWEETSKDQTFMYQSRLDSFLSNRAQDYKHARWELAQRYGHFLTHAPLEATQALFPITETHCRLDHNASAEIVPFEIAGIATGIREDYSHIWDTGWGGDENVHAILDEYFRNLQKQLEEPTRANLVAALIRFFVANARDAVLWRRLLDLAVKFPALANEIRDVAWTEPLLLAQDMTSPMYRFLEIVHPDLNREERERLENAIMALENIDEPRRQWGAYCRDTYLAALRDDMVVTEQARTRIAQLREAEQLRTSPPRDPVIQGGAMAIDPERFYADRGISTDGEINQEIVDLLRPIRDFCGQFSQNDGPDMAKALAILPAMIAAQAALQSSDPAVRSEELAHTAFGYLVEAAAKIALMPELDATSELGILVQRSLIDGVLAHWPATGADDEHYDGGWSSLPGRIEAVEGLFSLLGNPGFEVDPLLENLHKLANDTLPVVRFQVARRLLLLYERAPDAMWELLEALASDPNYRNRLEVITGLDRCARAHPDRAMPLIAKMLEDAGTARGKPDEVKQACIASLTCYYLWRNDGTAKSAIDAIIEGLPSTAHDAARMFRTLRDALAYAEPTNPERAFRTRERAAQVLNRIVAKAVPALRNLIEKRLAGTVPTSEERTQFDDLEHLLVVCGGELYFASGAFQEYRPGLAPVLTKPEQMEFYRAIAPSWDLLAEIGTPKLVHSMVQTLEMFVPADPARAFLLIGKSVLAGRIWKYHFESQAVDLIVRVIRACIAEHRSIFERNPECLRVLRQLLDLFITAGWSSARIVAYRVDEVFR